MRGYYAAPLNKPVHAIREDPDLHDAIIFMLTTSHRAEDKRSAYSLNVTGYIL